MKKICKLDDITLNTGVAALVNNRQIALFKVADEQVYAVDNTDPFSGSNVLSRGIIGENNDTIFVASPIYKQRFDLMTGRCLDDDSVQINAYPVVVKDSDVFLSL